tara:strand:- start:43653 stop:44264 length:612 start_codon:yes stop_codon:yes gene_type:complete
MSSGTLFVISAPSGTGKTSLVKALVTKLDNIQTSVSFTTREPRAGEVDGQHYVFVDEAKFLRYQEESRFLESAQVFKNWYGTSKDWVEEKLQSGLDVILEIDWQGARIVKSMLPCVTVFIIPPSKADLKDRLMARRQDKDDVIDFRMQKANEELSHYKEYDYLVVNDDFEQAVAELSCVVSAQRLTTGNQAKNHRKLLNELLT